jgi:hypothetical protein
VHDFVPQLLLSLLQNPDIMIQANLLIDVLKPLDKFDSPRGGQFGKVLSGSMYQQHMPLLLQTQSANCLRPLFNGLIAHILQAMLVSH